MSFLEEVIRVREQHGGCWGEHPDYQKEDWRTEVANNDTVLGYWEYVVHRMISEEEEPEL